jgi:RNase P subunit RPR2
VNQSKVEAKEKGLCGAVNQGLRPGAKCVLKPSHSEGVNRRPHSTTTEDFYESEEALFWWDKPEPKPTPSTPKCVNCSEVVTFAKECDKGGFCYAAPSEKLRALFRTEPKPTPSTPADYLHYLNSEEAEKLPLQDQIARLKKINANLCKTCNSYIIMNATAERRIKELEHLDSSSISTEQRLTNAIRWALGEGDDFRPRVVGEGAYWWRNELRARAFGPAAKGSTEVEGGKG